MTEHLTENQVEDYCRQQLLTRELLRVSDHLGKCEPCRRRIEYALNSDTAFFALRSEVFGDAADASSPAFEGAHLAFEQTAGYVDRSLQGVELQMVADHLNVCGQCSLAVDDLRAFKNEIAPSIEREYHPAAASSPAESWRHRMIVFLRAPFGQSPGLAFGAALTILLMALTGWLIWRTPPDREPIKEIAGSPTPQPQPEQLAAPVIQIVARLNDGQGQLMLDREGRLSGADDLPPVYQTMLKQALTGRRIETSPQLKGLTRPSSALMSGEKDDTAFSLIEPVGKMLLNARPTFRWSPMKGAAAYVVEVYNSKFELVATSPQLNDRSWVAPRSLPRGDVYSWQVTAIKDGQEFKSPRPPAPEAKFRILDQSKANELLKARRAYASSHLTLGLLYAEAGLLQEAEQELRALQRANPESEIARSLLNQLQALRR